MSTGLEDETMVAPDDGQENVEEHIAPEANNDEERIDQATERIRLRYKGIRVQVSGIPQSRKVSDAHKEEAAHQFGAKADSVSMSSLLWDAKEPAVKDLRSVLSSISRIWHDRTMTLPTTTDGLRMIKRDCVSEVNKRLKEAQRELGLKAAKLKNELPGIIEREKERRKRLFNADDYDFDPTQLVKVKWWFPTVTEDQELAELDDEVYQAEIRRVRDEMRGVVVQAETQMAEQLYDMLDSIVERLSGVEEKGRRKGKAKTFKDATVNKLFDELNHLSEQFKENGIGGEGLTTAARRINAVLKGQDSDTLPSALRTNGVYREHVADKCAKIADALLKQAVPEQRRRVLRKRAADRRK